jgi:hypothetical protein
MSFKPNLKDSEINQKYYRTDGSRTIAKVTVSGVDRFELFDAGKYLGFETSFDKAVESEKWK